MLKKALFWIPIVVTLALIPGVSSHAPATASANAAVSGSAKIRVGVYDNRAILMAWFDSKYNDLAELREELERAKQAGDDERVNELEAYGPVLQRRIHFQGFGRAPVTELLAHVEDRLPALAMDLGVDVIAFECNYAGDDVEVVDITLALVGLYDPSPETIRTVKSILKKDPVALEELTSNN